MAIIVAAVGVAALIIGPPVGIGPPADDAERGCRAVGAGEPALAAGSDSDMRETVPLDDLVVSMEGALLRLVSFGRVPEQGRWRGRCSGPATTRTVSGGSSGT